MNPQIFFLALELVGFTAGEAWNLHPEATDAGFFAGWSVEGVGTDSGLITCTRIRAWTDARIQDASVPPPTTHHPPLPPLSLSSPDPALLHSPPLRPPPRSPSPLSLSPPPSPSLPSSVDVCPFARCVFLSSLFHSP